MSERPWLILPIETKARELDAKTYLACAAAEAGFRVLLGEQNALLRRLSRLPRGFYLDKSIAPLKIPSFERLKKLGFRIGAWCEEGLVYRNRDAYLHERVAPQAFDEIEAFFAWGGVHAADVRDVVHNVPERIFETGNPRLDLLRPGLREFYRPDAEALRARFGDFILINTNFGRYNHYFGRDKVLDILKTRGLVRHAKDETFFRGWIDFLGQVFHSFEDMLPRLAKAFPTRTIVLRPHPSENHDTWRKIAAGIPNVQVIYEGGVVPWLMASALSIHNGCTTGIEGALLDKPAIAYRKERSETYDSFLPHRVSVNVDSFDELAGAVESVFAGNYRAPLRDDAAVRADVARYIASLEGPSATERILSHIWALPDIPLGKGALTARLLDRGEQALRTVARTVLAPVRSTGGYAKQKFPGLQPREIETLVERYRALTGRFGTVTVRPEHTATVTMETG
ncbi:MAG TPA: surface carbohydrate biosynthesis protein [Xanthobacteraceae bacterium]|nr:surface carbohydrate biosynthesis protein [Xanthobacteraceae bacterium]